jgi:triosephosphate isomerase (TIM)
MGLEGRMRQLIAGNWKMHGLSAEAAALAQGVRAGAAGLGCELVVCPPYTQVGPVAKVLAGSTVAVGGQDCHANRLGPHTGDISAEMLADLGARYVILGHSERRIDHAETSERVRQKVQAALDAGLVPIVCVGETADERGGGRENEVVGWQMSGSLPDGFAGVLAYEPIWAIGTGHVPTCEEVAAMHAFIREELQRQFPHSEAAIRILYGGSVKPANALELLGLPEVGGALVGGASLEAEAFLTIAQAARAG